MRGVVCINKLCRVVPITLSLLDLSWAVRVLGYSSQGDEIYLFLLQIEVSCHCH